MTRLWRGNLRQARELWHARRAIESSGRRARCRRTRGDDATTARRS